MTRQLIKNFQIIVVLIGVQLVYSQAVITKNLGDFNTVKVFDKITLNLILADENRITIKGTNSEAVELVTKNEELKIRMPLKKLLKGDEVIVNLYYKKIYAISASEGASVTSEFPIKQIAIDINSKEGAWINLNLEVKKATVRASSGAQIELQGTTENQDITLTSGATLTAKNLESIQTSITVNSGATASIFATELVEAKASTGGTITVYGQPKHLSKKKSLGGTIIESK